MITLTGGYRISFRERIEKFCSENNLKITYRSCIGDHDHYNIGGEIDDIDNFEKYIEQLEKERKHKRTKSFDINLGIKRGDLVKLKFSSEDLESEDLGMSGIVLESPLKKIERWKDSQFLVIGTLQENTDFIIINLQSIDRDFVIHKSYLQKTDL